MSDRWMLFCRISRDFLQSAMQIIVPGEYDSRGEELNFDFNIQTNSDVAERFWQASSVWHASLRGNIVSTGTGQLHVVEVPLLNVASS